MAGYVRQSSAQIIPDAVIMAGDLNNEFNALAGAFRPADGHSHDGSAGNGPKIDLTTSVSGALPIENGGTGATDAATALTNLGAQTMTPSLDALSKVTTTGIAVKSGASAWTTRAISGKANEVEVSNGNGVSGNPTISLSTSLTFTGKSITGGTFTGGTFTGGTFTGGTFTNGTFSGNGAGLTGIPVASITGLDTALTSYVLLNGSRPMTGPLTLSGAPTAANHASTKSYVDGKKWSGSDITSGTIPVARIPHMIGSDSDSYVRITNALNGNNSVGGAMCIATNGQVYFTYNGTNIFEVDTSGTMKYVSIPAALVNSGTLADARIPNLAATKITSGSFHVDRIPNLDAGKTTSGVFAEARIPTLTAAKIPNLDAGKITSGTLADARIPNLNASKVTAGTFVDARIPNLAISKINGLQAALNERPSAPSASGEYPIGTVMLLMRLHSSSWPDNANASASQCRIPIFDQADQNANTSAISVDRRFNGTVNSGSWKNISGNRITSYGIGLCVRVA